MKKNNEIIMKAETVLTFIQNILENKKPLIILDILVFLYIACIFVGLAYSLNVFTVVSIINTISIFIINRKSKLTTRWRLILIMVITFAGSTYIEKYATDEFNAIQEMSADK